QGDDLHDSRKATQSPSSKRNANDSTTYAPVFPGVSDEFHDTNDTNEGKQPLQSTKVLNGALPEHPLPSIDFGSGTKFQCLVAISSGIACSLACIICSIG